jgi:ferredoxin
VYGKHITVRHLQSFGAAGLQALAQSLQQEFRNAAAAATNNNYVTVRFQAPHHHTEFDLKWYNYQTAPLLSVAERTPEGAQLLSEYLERACSGNAMCCTCHVYIDIPNKSNHHDQEVLQLNPKSTAEKDMLDLAFEPNPTTSRLACQVRLTHVPKHHVNADEPVLTVILPAGVHNLF